MTNDQTKAEYLRKVEWLRRYREAQRTMRRCMEELAQLRAEAAQPDARTPVLPPASPRLDAPRVDRAQPSGNDFLADALNRPRRHKRKE